MENFKEMKASQKDTSAAADRRERERIREEKEMQRLMSTSGNLPPITSTPLEKKAFTITTKPGFKKVSTTTGSGGGWKTVGLAVKKSDAELSWGNDGEDEYDPAYPTPA
jgi:hypothetical protein